MNTPKAHSQRPGQIEEGLDKLIVVLAALLVLFLAAMFRYGAPNARQLFFDPSSVPWDAIWEGIKTLGAGAAVLKGAFWVKRKLSGEDRYFRAIYDTLDSSPDPLPKSIVKETVRNKIENSNHSRFSKRFDHMWHKMRKLGYIKKVGVSTAKEGEVKEPLYSLNENQGKGDDKT